MGQGKQAKILSPQQAAAALRHFETTRYPLRGQAMFLLSTKTGLPAKEIAELTWAMVTDGNGELGAVIALENKASKGTGGGRTIPLHPQLQVEAGGSLRDVPQLAGHVSLARTQRYIEGDSDAKRRLVSLI